MAHHEPLRISCEGCPGGCDDCLVEFFLAERDARVVRLGRDAGERSKPRSSGSGGPVGSSPPRLDPDLARAFDVLDVAGLRPRVLSVRPNQHRESRAS